MSHKRKLTNFALADRDGEYSANPSDYFMMADDQKFKNLVLVATEHKRGGWTRRVVVKKNPMKKDLPKE
jgi:hypothetical protein